MDTSFPPSWYLLLKVSRSPPLERPHGRVLERTGDWPTQVNGRVEQTGYYVVEGLAGGHVSVLSGPLLQDTITHGNIYLFGCFRTPVGSDISAQSELLESVSSESGGPRRSFIRRKDPGMERAKMAQAVVTIFRELRTTADASRRFSGSSWTSSAPWSVPLGPLISNCCL